MAALALQYALNGLATGSLFVLVALGIVILYRTSRILNFAHGDIATFGTFVAFTLITRLGVAPPLAYLVTLGATGFLGAGFYYFILRRAKEATLLGQIVITLGFALVLNGIVVILWGADTKVFPSLLSETKVYHLGTIVISQLSLGSLLVGFLLMALLYILVQSTKVGLAMRAVSQNPLSAQTLGIPTRRILALSWGVASALGASAGILLAPVTLLDPFMMLDPFLKGFAAAVLGGMDSPPGAVVGGLALGVVESLFGGFVSVAFKATLAFAIIVLVLTVRPEGLLGREYKKRV